MQPLCLQSVATGSLLARPFLSPQLQAFEVDCLVRELDMCVPVRSSVFTRYAWLLQVARVTFGSDGSSISVEFSLRSLLYLSPSLSL